MKESFLRYYLYRVLGSVGPFLPPSVGYRLASQLGSLAFDLKRREARTVKENLSHVLGRNADKAATDAIAREVFRNLSKNYYDLFHNHAMSTEQMSASVTVEGLSHLEDTLALGRGLVLTSAHFGLFDAVWAIFPGLNLKVTAAAEHLKPERFYQYMCKIRASDHITFLPVDGPLFGLFRALRRGEIVAVAADRDITRSGIIVDFFDAPARLPDGHVQLALRTGAKIVPCFTLRRADNSAILHVEPPLELEETGDFKRDVRVNVRKVIARLEEWIGRHPEQWLMLHPVWRDAEKGNAN